MSFFVGPFSSPLAWGNTLNQSSLLVLTGLAASVAFGAGAFNLGGEGQVYLGGLAALAAALFLPPVWGALGILAALVSGMVAGAGLGAVSGALKARWQADELITTFLLSASVVPVVDSLITSPLFGAAGSFLITSRKIPQEFWLPGLLAPSNLYLGCDCQTAHRSLVERSSFTGRHSESALILIIIGILLISRTINF
jgi:simple sugar transport system permease protein